jgi:hypothetical protein
LGSGLKDENLELLGEDWDAAPKITEETEKNTDKESHLCRTVFCPTTLRKNNPPTGLLISVLCS